MGIIGVIGHRHNVINIGIQSLSVTALYTDLLEGRGEGQEEAKKKKTGGGFLETQAFATLSIADIL